MELQEPQIDNQVENSSIEDGTIDVYGAREHNLKNVDLSIPRNALVVFTGLSGSGKSSLAFDTIYAEGQRRYMETFSAYARQFMGNLQRPDVDKIDGLSPVISIEQKTVSKNPRSTVGTITEIYDFLRLLFAKGSTAYSSETGKPMVKFTDEQIYNSILENFEGKSIQILSPLVKRRKGHYRELFEQYRKIGYNKIRVDGEILEITPKMQVDRYKIHDIELFVDKINVANNSEKRLRLSIENALKQGKGSIIILEEESGLSKHYSRNLMCADTGISYDDPQPNTFSFNSPYGWCPSCKGLGYSYQFQIEDIMPDTSKSFKNGALMVFPNGIDNWHLSIIKTIGKIYKHKITDPVNKWSKEAIHDIFYGIEDKITVEYNYVDYNTDFGGLVSYFEDVLVGKGGSQALKDNLERLGQLADCTVCKGQRLNSNTENFKIGDYTIGNLANLEIDNFYDEICKNEKKLSNKEKQILGDIYVEIKTRTKFLLNIGLNYLSLNRPAFTLSGGEAQRIRLATQIGSQLMNVTYILDEPSIGLHQRDNDKLIKSLQDLRDYGNTVVVVEHDRDMMEAADCIVDIGPRAGKLGGQIMATGRLEDIIKGDSITADYLSGRRKIEIPTERRKGNGEFLELKGARGHNLKNVSLKLPLGTLICITGVSGSGKSTLISDTLYPILRRHFYRSFASPLPYESLEGLELLDKVIEIDQAPIGRTPRSNPATYTGLFTFIRNLYSELPEAKIRGYKPGRFSFNVKGGRCETCQGGGAQVIEMNFMPDVQVTCPTCMGKRYNRETLEVRYKGKSINDVLDMNVTDALNLFDAIPSIKRKLEALHNVGLGYINVGQSSVTLSGGEAQRIKLATELSKRDTGKTIYILDEPTTGLHFDDINILMQVLQKLVDRGNTVVIIEHNLDVIKLADYVVDMGPEGGRFGGEIVATGTPEKVAKSKKSVTAKFLAQELKK